MRLTLRISLLLAGLFLPLTAFASTDFPFTLSKSSDGKIATIEIPEALMDSGDDLLEDLRTAVANVSEERGFDDEYSAASLSEEERKAFEEAKLFLAHGFDERDLDDPRLDVEFSKARKKLNGLKVFRLIASPYDAAAFDQENATKEAIKGILDAAKLIFTLAPAYSIFEFLVDSHLDNLASRREFHQNRLLVWMDHSPAALTMEEAGLVRSSIHYSRISLIDTKSRKNARAAWATFGNERTAAIASKCNGYASRSETTFGPCFKIAGKEIRNGLVKFNLTSKRSSLAFDYENPYRVRNGRIGWFALKLGLKLVPAPVVIKKGVSTWIGSHYTNQRTAEGFLYESARLQGQDALASWIAVGSANPVLMAK